MLLADSNRNMIRNIQPLLLGKNSRNSVHNLGGERFVVRDNEGRSLDAFNGICNTKRFSRAGRPQEGLYTLPFVEAVYEAGDGGGLVAAQFVLADYLKLLIAFRHGSCLHGMNKGL